VRLLIIRHAIAEDRDEFARTGQPDDLRPLTPAGRKKMVRGARGLRRLVPEIDLLAASPLTRAQQTARIVAKAYEKPRFETTDVLRPDASFTQFISWTRSTGPHETVAVVGHDPHLSTLITWLMTGSDAPGVVLTKGGAALLTFNGAPRRAGGKLEWLLKAKQLRQ
jgi:phosphohistidine phosphatase